MTGRTNARNTAQRAGTITRAAGRVINAAIGIYTCPANTKARLTDIQGIVDALGVDATYALAIKDGAVYTPITLFRTATAPNNTMSASAVTLTAGQILTNIGDSGSTNGTVDISATVEEFGV